MRSLLADLGITATIEIITDSTAAKGTASRVGIGKIKHLDVGWFWIQDFVKNRDIVLMKINGKVDPADLMTKPKSAAEAVRLTMAVGYGLIIRKRANETFRGPPRQSNARRSRATRGEVRNHGLVVLADALSLVKRNIRERTACAFDCIIAFT